jgi:Flp pilus assembly pilin Flp
LPGGYSTWPPGTDLGRSGSHPHRYRSARFSEEIGMRGVTTTQYALILAAVAVVVFGTYLALGSNVRFLVSGVDSALTTTSGGASQATPTP